MSIFVGSQEIPEGKLQIGGTPITRVYVGATQIWPPSSPVKTYLLSANFDGPDQALAAGTILGASEGVQVGLIRVKQGDTAAIKSAIESNNYVSGSKTGNNANNSGISDNAGVASALGRTFLLTFDHNNTPDASSLAIFSESGIGRWNNGHPSVYVGDAGILGIVTGGAGVFTAETGITVQGVQHHLAVVDGGYNNAGKPYEPGDTVEDFLVGTLIFYKEGSGQWRLIHRDEESSLANLFLQLTGRYDANEETILSSMRIPEDLLTSLFAMSFFSDAVTASLPFTHPADCLVGYRVASLPSSGVIEVRFRIDWAVTIDSSGNVTLIEDADGSRTSRGSLNGVVSANTHIAAKCYGQKIRLIVDSASTVEYALATSNQGATSGVVFSLGTGGSLAHLFTMAYGSGNEYALLNDYPGL